MNPRHSIGKCPICGGGLCGIRLCQGPGPEPVSPAADRSPHGLIVCDECEAIWVDPDTMSRHWYPDPEDERCPVCGVGLWSDRAHWATAEEIASLGWADHVNPDLDCPPKEEKSAENPE